MQSTQMDVKEYGYFVDNQWREAADKKFFEVLWQAAAALVQAEKQPPRGKLVLKVM